MTKQQKPKPKRKKRPDSNSLGRTQLFRYSGWSPGMQLGAWLCVAAIALIYLYALLGFKAESQDIAGADGLGPGSGDAGSLDPKNDTLAGQIETLRREIIAMKQRERVLETRIADLQTALGPVTGAISKPRDDAKKRAAPAIDVQRSTLPSSGFGDELTADSPVPAERSAQPTRTLFAVSLGEDTSLDDMRRRWRDLVAKHPPQLKDLEARYALVPQMKRNAAPRYSLIAGPFGNAADAALVCARLSAREQACEQTTFMGEKIGEADLSLPDRKPKVRQSANRRPSMRRPAARSPRIRRN